MQAEHIWAQLQSFALDNSEAGYKFSDRLAEENNWSKDFALLAIEEYKKFMFLSACAGHDVTPSKIIDKVWHLHLIYTRSYWEEMCGKILGKRIHHNPTEGSNEEDSKYSNQYEQTLNSYTKFFDTAPPVNIWGGQNNIIEPKKTFSVKKVMACFSPFLLFLLFLDSINPFLILLLLAVFCIFIIMIIGGIADYRHDKRKEKEREEERNRYRTYSARPSKSLSSMASNPNKGKDKGMDSNKKSNNSNESSINPVIFPISTCSSSDNSSSNSSHSNSDSSSGHSSSCSSSSCGGGGGCGGGE